MNNNKGRPRKYTLKDLEEINKHIESGLTIKQAGAKIGIEYSGGVYRMASKLGVPKRYFTNKTEPEI